MQCRLRGQVMQLCRRASLSWTRMLVGVRTGNFAYGIYSYMPLLVCANRWKTPVCFSCLRRVFRVIFVLFANCFLCVSRKNPPCFFLPVFAVFSLVWPQHNQWIVENIDKNSNWESNLSNLMDLSKEETYIFNQSVQMQILITCAIASSRRPVAPSVTMLSVMHPDPLPVTLCRLSWSFCCLCYALTSQQPFPDDNFWYWRDIQWWQVGCRLQDERIISLHFCWCWQVPSIRWAQRVRFHATKEVELCKLLTQRKSILSVHLRKASRVMQSTSGENKTDELRNLIQVLGNCHEYHFLFLWNSIVNELMTGAWISILTFSWTFLLIVNYFFSFHSFSWLYHHSLFC